MKGTSVAVARQRIHLPPKGWRRALTASTQASLWDGEDIRRFEKAFAEFIGVPDAVAIPSGRAGLRFIFEALDLEPEAEVICSAFAYPVVPHLARSLGFSVRFADCEMESLGMDPEALEAAITERTKVVIATHLYGIPCRIREIAEIAEAHGAILIEDCAHCYGASVGGRKAGAFGRFGYFSFETSKPINTMGGGMVTTQDPELAERIREVASKEPAKNLAWLRKRLIKTTFESTVTNPLVFNLGVYPALRLLQSREGSDERFASGYQPDEITMQGRMGRYTNYQASLGLDQMQIILPQLERRVANAQRLIGQLKDSVKFQTHEVADVHSNYMLVTALFPQMHVMARRLLELGVDTKHHYMRDCSALLDDGRTFPRAAQAEREILHLPAYPEISDSKIDWIAERVQQAVDEIGSGK